MTTSTIRLRASQLRDLLSPVLPFAATDDSLPILCSVHLTVTGEWLIATATDRYRLGMCRQRLDDSDFAQSTAFIAVVGTADLAAILAVARPTRLADPLVSLTVDGELLVVEQAEDLSGSQYADLRVAVRLVDGTYPQLAGITHKLMGARMSASRRIGLNPRLLADFRHVQRSIDEPLVVWHTQVEGKKAPPVGVACGEHFLGALMPVHLLHEKDEPEVDPTTEWAALLGAPLVEAAQPVAVGA